MAGQSGTKKWRQVEKWEVTDRNALANNSNQNKEQGAHLSLYIRMTWHYFETGAYQIDGILDGITLATRGLEELFSSCAVVSVFCSCGKQVLVLHTTCVIRVPYSCGVVLVFLLWREIGVGVTYVLSVQYSCAVVSVFCCGRKANLVQIFLLNPRIFFSYILVSLFQRNNSLSKIYFL